VIKYARNSSEKLVVDFVANRVRKLRLDRGWTQEDLANESEVSLAQIKRIELGYINTSLLVLFKITISFEVTLDEFFKPNH
jgi:transcriptional regulator with XRE-family HTH domain